MMKALLCSFLFLSQAALAVETSFIAVDVHTGAVVASSGPALDQRVTPASTFKVALSPIGYDVGILKSVETPVWTMGGAEVSGEATRGYQSPRTWMSLSVVWYSKILMQKIGRDVLQKYLSLFAYGNQDITGEANQQNGFLSAHLSSSLKISPREQVGFMRKLVSEQLPVSPFSIHMTKELLFNNTSGKGWKIFAKTGSGFQRNARDKIAWLVGWVERADQQYAFALFIRGTEGFPTKGERQQAVNGFFKGVGIEIE
jgi:beta-lactamase class D